MGVVYYDGECGWCRGLAEGNADRLARRGYRAEPLQGPGVAERLGVTEAALRAEMHLLTPDGRCRVGADALLELARVGRWSRPLAWVGGWPGVHALLRRAYRWVADHRTCRNGACALPEAAGAGRVHTFGATVPRKVRHRARLAWIDVVPLVVWTALAWVLTPSPAVPGWVRMWSLAIAIYAGCKVLMLAGARRAGLELTWPRRLAFLFGWVGMNPWEFDGTRTRGSGVRLVDRGALAAALGRVGLGALVLTQVVPRWADEFPLAAGWAGMTGIILMLHFGLFDLLALAWRRAGVPVTALMRAPTRARSVADFWGARWNRAFHFLVQESVHRPLLPRAGRALAALVVFGASGLVHDLVIAVPAGGGFGLPTGYFLFQGAALLLERSPVGTRLGLGRGALGRIYAWVVVAGPAFWLFPPVFVHQVILPMLRALGVA